MNTLEDVYQEWLNNPEFRELFKKNPSEALKKTGLQLSSKDLKKIQILITTDEELDKRINK